MLNSRFGYSMKKNSFKGLNIDCIQYSNIIRITYYSYSYSGTILNPNIIRIRIRPNIIARILFIFVFAYSEKNEYYLYSYSVKILIPNSIRIRIRSKKQYSLTSGLYNINSHLVDNGGLEVDKNRSRHVLPRWRLREERVEGVVRDSQGVVRGHLTVRHNPWP